MCHTLITISVKISEKILNTNQIKYQIISCSTIFVDLSLAYLVVCTYHATLCKNCQNKMAGVYKWFAGKSLIQVFLFGQDILMLDLALQRLLHGVSDDASTT